jgi:ABC-2 type transport system permease protein
MNQQNKYLTLVRREIWEHRSLWLLPLTGAGLLLFSTLFGPAVHNGVDVTITPIMPAGVGGAVGAISSAVIMGVVGLFACIVAFFYLLDCLSAERKDRSILFWKSLPVSDAETVLAKLSVALVLLPLFVLVVSVLLQPLLAGILALRIPEVRPHLGELLGGSFAALPRMIGIGIFALLWYAPVAAYMMLASVLARRAPIVYAIVPPVALCIAERLLLNSGLISRFFGERLMPWPERRRYLVVIRDYDGDGIATISHDWWKLFADLELWLGVAAAVGIVYAVIRLRRYRDDT